MYRKFISDLSNAQRAFIIPHFHNEALIFALKENGIHCTELQHGLYAKVHFFYIYPESCRSVSKRALFADRFLVWGPFWQQLLDAGNEYHAGQIEVIGDYRWQQPDVSSTSGKWLSEQKTGGRKTVVIATQRGLSDYSDYIKWLATDCEKRGIAHCILIKPHPDDSENYHDLIENFCHVHLVSYSIESLCQHADILISIYSGCLYDAVKYPIDCYALDVERFADHVSAIVDGWGCEITSFRSKSAC